MPNPKKITFYVVTPQYRDKNGEWSMKGSTSVVCPTMERVEEIRRLEGRDLSCGGLLRVTTTQRRLRVRTVEVVAEKYLRV